MEHFKLIITIVDRGKGTKAVDLYRSHHLHFDFACLGAGTASSKILNYFGLDETAKELVWTLAPASRIPPLLPEVHRVLDLSTPGRGILFTIPLSGISAQIPQVLLKPEYEKEEPAMEEAKKRPPLSAGADHCQPGQLRPSDGGRPQRRGTGRHGYLCPPCGL